LEQLKREISLIQQVARDDNQVINAWARIVDQIADHILMRDPKAFLTWDPVCRVMFLRGMADHIMPKMNYLRRRSDWPMWRRAIQEDEVGQPATFREYAGSSGTRILHAYHLAKLEETSGIRLWEMPFVFEFGGGYGGMMRLVQKMGFNGRYIIFDMPVVSALQRYYLRALDVPVELYDCCSAVDDLQKELKSFDPETSVFLATMSFSESPLGMRQPIVETVRSFGTIFIAYADKFYGIDNASYFSNLTKDLNHFEWKQWAMDERPWKMYLLGRRREPA